MHGNGDDTENGREENDHGLHGVSHHNAPHTGDRAVNKHNHCHQHATKRRVQAQCLEQRAARHDLCSHDSERCTNIENGHQNRGKLALIAVANQVGNRDISAGVKQTGHHQCEQHIGKACAETEPHTADAIFRTVLCTADDDTVANMCSDIGTHHHEHTAGFTCREEVSHRLAFFLAGKTDCQHTGHIDHQNNDNNCHFVPP